METLLEILPFKTIKNMLLIDHTLERFIKEWLLLHPISQSKNKDKDKDVRIKNVARTGILQLINELIRNYETNDWNMGLA